MSHLVLLLDLVVASLLLQQEVMLLDLVKGNPQAVMLQVLALEVMSHLVAMLLLDLVEVSLLLLEQAVTLQMLVLEAMSHLVAMLLLGLLLDLVEANLLWAQAKHLDLAQALREVLMCTE